MSYAKLRGRIKEKFGTENRFAEALGVSKMIMSSRLTKRTPWTMAEIQKGVDLLEIDWANVYEYFFAENVR